MLIIKSTVMTELSVRDKQRGPERRERVRERESEGETPIVSQSEILHSTGRLSGKKTLQCRRPFSGFFLKLFTKVALTFAYH